MTDKYTVYDEDTRDVEHYIANELARIADALTRPSLVEINTPDDGPIVIALDSLRWIGYHRVYLTNDHDTIAITPAERDRLLAYLRETGRMVNLREDES